MQDGHVTSSDVSCQESASQCSVDGKPWTTGQNDGRSGGRSELSSLKLVGGRSRGSADYSETANVIVSQFSWRFRPRG